MGIDEPRIRAKGGNGREQFVAPEFSKTLDRRWYNADIRQLVGFGWKFVVGVISVVTIVGAAWYHQTSEVAAHADAIVRAERDIAKLQETAKSKESAADDLRVIAVQMESFAKRLESIDNRLERMERRRPR